MGKRYRLLSINAAMTRQENWMRREKTDDSFSIDVDAGVAYLRGMLRTLVREGYVFEDAVFTTHGNSGRIFIGDEVIRWKTWYDKDWYSSGYDRLFPFPHTKLYFSGCNVAEDTDGWRFLEAAVRTFCRPEGGTAIGWTSSGFSWFPSGHSKHLWGDTRQVMLVDDSHLRFFENWKRVDDGVNRPT